MAQELVLFLAAMPSPSVFSFTLFGVGMLLLRSVIGPKGGQSEDR